MQGAVIEPESSYFTYKLKLNKVRLQSLLFLTFLLVMSPRQKRGLVRTPFNFCTGYTFFAISNLTLTCGLHAQKIQLMRRPSRKSCETAIKKKGNLN